MTIYKTYKEAIKEKAKRKKYQDLAKLFENVDIDRFFKRGIDDFIEKLPLELKLIGQQFYEEIMEEVIIYDKDKSVLILDSKIKSSRMNVGEINFPFNIVILCNTLIKDWGVVKLKYLSLANNCFVKEDLKYIREITDRLEIEILDLSGNRIILNQNDFEDILFITNNVSHFVDFTLNYFQSDCWVLHKIKENKLIGRFIWVLPEFVRSKDSDDPMNAGWLKHLKKLNMSIVIDDVYYAHVQYKTEILELHLNKFY